MTVVKLFRALGDPTRIEIVRRLSGGKPYTITMVSDGLKISRQGARKHLQILADAKAIKFEPKGRDTLVRLNREEINKAKEFIAELEFQWDNRLNNLRNFVEGKA